MSKRRLAGQSAVAATTASLTLSQTELCGSSAAARALSQPHHQLVAQVVTQRRDRIGYVPLRAQDFAKSVARLLPPAAGTALWTIFRKYVGNKHCAAARMGSKCSKRLMFGLRWRHCEERIPNLCTCIKMLPKGC
jgi:hypothetical protein